MYLGFLLLLLGWGIYLSNSLAFLFGPSIFASSEKSVGHRYAPMAPEARLAQPLNSMWSSAASAFPVRNQLPFELVALSGKRYAIREDRATLHGPADRPEPERSVPLPTNSLLHELLFSSG